MHRAFRGFGSGDRCRLGQGHGFESGQARRSRAHANPEWPAAADCTIRVRQDVRDCVKAAEEIELQAASRVALPHWLSCLRQGRKSSTPNRNANRMQP